MTRIDAGHKSFIWETRPQAVTLCAFCRGIRRPSRSAAEEINLKAAFKLQSRTLAFAIALSALALDARAEAVAEESWNAYGQFTHIFVRKDAFAAA